MLVMRLLPTSHSLRQWCIGCWPGHEHRNETPEIRFSIRRAGCHREGTNPRSMTWQGAAQRRHEALAEGGVCLEAQMPYRTDIKNNSHEPQFVVSQHSDLIADAVPYKRPGYVRLQTVDDMMQSLVVNGPFVIGVNWLDGWFNPKKKVNGYPVLHPTQGVVAGGHALCVVGFDESIKVFKFKNSWSTSWASRDSRISTSP
jgi:hypothetical protein